MPQRGKKKGRAASGADPRSLPLTPAAANSFYPLNHAPNNMETSTAAAAALLSQAAPRPAAPLSLAAARTLRGPRVSLAAADTPAALRRDHRTPRGSGNAH